MFKEMKSKKKLFTHAVNDFPNEIVFPPSPSF